MPCYYEATTISLYIVASSVVVAGGNVTAVEGTSDPGKREETAGEEKEEGREGGQSHDDVRVHIEAVVGGLELVLYSHVGGVAEVKVKGTSCPTLQLSVYVYLYICF